MIVALFASPKAEAQTEVMAWSNMTGIRIEGQLIEFESSFRIVESNWTGVFATGRERQGSQYSREGSSQTVKLNAQRISFEQTVTDKNKGVASVSISYQSDTTRKVEGVYYSFALPVNRYSAATVQIGGTQIPVASLSADSKKASGNKIVIKAPGRNIQIDLTSSVTAFVRKEAGAPTLYIQLLGSNLKKGQKGKLGLTITASGDIDSAPVEVVIDRHNPGRLFAGFGGNFRLQNPTNDPQVIDYCLDNMRVAFGRAEMPWAVWQPEENSDPIAIARGGNLNERVDRSMKMAQRLAAKGMPVIISAWFPPKWALMPGQTRGFGGVAGLKLDPAKTEKIYKSLTDYLVYLKQEYGVEAYAFSFNESDIGIDVLHTAQEHADLIKGLGAYLASRGLATKMLLGDNSDATTFDWILPALNDPKTHEYIAAVSFHSWRGCDDETLKKWGGAAKQLNLPLLIGEGSTDAAAHRYPQIFLEPTFALYEINLYIRIAAISQPLSILQWQLTSDYSLLWGNGIYGSTGSLRPTQRFWNLKQLASTPPEVFALPFTSSKEEVNCAAYGSAANGSYAVHLVNNGAARKAIIKGLPALSNIKVYVTTDKLNMQEAQSSKAADGSLSVDLPAMAYVTLIGK
jgi:O-glycosyl hydrolase